jgi:uncharacterized membrane protein
MTRATILALVWGFLLAGCSRREGPPGKPAGEGDAQPSVPEAVSPVPAFRALGTEPFWALFIDAAGLRFATPEDTAGIRFPALAPMAHGDTLHWVGETERARIDARIWPGQCSDGMSDKIWTHGALVRIGDTEYHGCAEEDSQRPDPIGEWVVAAHRIPGIAAMTEAEAAKRHGHAVRFGREEAVSAADACRGVDYRHRTAPAGAFLAEYRITPADLGLQGGASASLEVTEVFCGAEKWAAMGGTLIWIAEDRAYTPWDGVFFELRRASPKGARGAATP